MINVTRNVGCSQSFYYPTRETPAETSAIPWNSLLPHSICLTCFCFIASFHFLGCCRCCFTCYIFPEICYWRQVTDITSRHWHSNQLQRAFTSSFHSLTHFKHCLDFLLCSTSARSSQSVIRRIHTNIFLCLLCLTAPVPLLMLPWQWFGCLYPRASHPNDVHPCVGHPVCLFVTFTFDTHERHFGCVVRCVTRRVVSWVIAVSVVVIVGVRKNLSHSTSDTFEFILRVESKKMEMTKKRKNKIKFVEHHWMRIRGESVVCNDEEKSE